MVESHFEKQPIEPERISEKEAPETAEEIPEEISKKEEIPETAPEEEISLEVKREAGNFDKELAEIVTKQVASDELSFEKANEILEEAEKLSPEDKFELRKDLEQEKKLSEEELKEKEKAIEEFQESISEYEKAIDDLVLRAEDVGVKISPDQLREYLEKFRNIEPQPGEEMEWKKYLDAQFKNLEKKISELEEMKQGGKLTPEKRQQIQKDITAFLEEMTAKIAEFIVKLGIRIAKGVIKGIFRTFRK